MLCASLAARGAEVPSNPPPTSKLSGHGQYEIQPLKMGAPYAGQDTNEKAKAKIQEYLDNEVAPLLDTWGKADKPEDTQTTLVVVPEVQSIRFISGGKRFWAGTLAGSSSVVLKVTLLEQPSGTVIGEPQFFQRASAQSGAWTFGAQDNDMLRRIVVLMKGYLEANYSEAVGGPTGHDK